jgi:hypothetical protein
LTLTNEFLPIQSITGNAVNAIKANDSFHPCDYNAEVYNTHTLSRAKFPDKRIRVGVPEKKCHTCQSTFGEAIIHTNSKCVINF